MALKPSLWETLPKELLHLVFARLHISEIGQLRVLSKEWKGNIDCKDSEFHQVLDATTPFKMFALLSLGYDNAISFTGNIYDLQAAKWHVSKTDAIFKRNLTFHHGADGGLVCYALNPECTSYPKIFIVMNLLSKQKMQLPPLLSMGAKESITSIWMVKLTMDRKTKDYKVYIVALCIDKGLEHESKSFFAQVYDSHLKEWMIVEATQDHIIARNYFITKSYSYHFNVIDVYNCADRRLQCFFQIDIAPGLKIERDCYELIEDHLFVLHKEASSGLANILEDGASMLQRYYISEFHLPKNSTAWVKLGMWSCVPCKCFCDTPHNILNLRLSGCNGFLLVYGACSKCAWQYDLSSCEWHNIPAFGKPLHISTMWEISWNAIA